MDKTPKESITEITKFSKEHPYLAVIFCLCILGIIIILLYIGYPVETKVLPSSEYDINAIMDDYSDIDVAVVHRFYQKYKEEILIFKSYHGGRQEFILYKGLPEPKTIEYSEYIKESNPTIDNDCTENLSQTKTVML